MALQDLKTANAFGFDWPGEPHVQVTRTSKVKRGKRGTWKVLTIHSVYGEATVYISPTGRFRIFVKSNRSPAEEWMSGVERSRRGKRQARATH